MEKSDEERGEKDYWHENEGRRFPPPAAAVHCPRQRQRTTWGGSAQRARCRRTGLLPCVQALDAQGLSAQASYADSARTVCVVSPCAKWRTDGPPARDRMHAQVLTSCRARRWDVHAAWTSRACVRADGTCALCVRFVATIWANALAQCPTPARANFLLAGFFLRASSLSFRHFSIFFLNFLFNLNKIE